MTGRDRIVITVVAALVIIAAAWMLVVSPERNKAAKLATEVSAAQGQLASAESQLSSASAAQARYQADYAAIVSLGKAVPASEEEPALIYQLAQATNQKNVEFNSIALGGSGSGSSASASASAKGASAGGVGAAGAAGAGFKQMPFTFTFTGSFDSLYNLFTQLNGFALRTSAGGLRVRGRLLTIQNVNLSTSSGGGPGAGGSGAGASTKGGAEQLTGTITATAYVLSAGQSLTSGATPAGPAGTATQTASTGASSSPNTPAVIQANP